MSLVRASDRPLDPRDLRQLPRIAELTEFTPDPGSLGESGIVGFDPRHSAVRPFNLLRTQVVKRCAQKGWKAIGVTSAEPAAGKSFVSLNLAAALSRLESQQVYLFDLDFARASVGEALGLPGSPGLADYLAGETDDLTSIGRRVAGGNLAVFPTRRWNGSTASVFSGPRFAELAAMMRQVPDGTIVLCDLPPVFANDDAMIILQALDTYVAVVNSGETNGKQLADIFTMLEPAPRLGTVLNRYNGGLADPLGYGSKAGAYKGYY